jgi:two-component system, NarL family, invasion response regulator UvrY
MIRILIADDHSIVREGLKQILAETPDMKVTGEASNAEEVLQRVREERWDIVILDISLPDRNGLEVMKQIKDQYPKLPILILSMHAEAQYAVRALKSGASGYLTKESASHQLIDAIKDVAEGGKYVSPSLANKIILHLGEDPPKQPHEILSAREHQVFFMIVSGKSLKEISNELSLSIKTISTHRSRILQKMGMKNNVELIRYAIQNNIVS